jgi:hypothetical protein
MSNKLWIDKDLEGSGQDLIEGLSRRSSGRTGENHETSQPGYQVSRLRFERVPPEHVTKAFTGTLTRSTWIFGFRYHNVCNMCQNIL